MPNRTITLSTHSASYAIHVGQDLLAGLHERLQALIAGRPLRCVAVTSPTIWELWKERFLASFPAEAMPLVLMLPEGEEHKRMAAVDGLAEQMAAGGADRDTLLIAFGGGVIGDVTGFLAAIYMRGVPFVQVPTTLLAQVDSSVGGKTGVNLRAGKNLIGSFHQPLAVYVDLDLLSTLPARQLRAGLQESVKAGAICDLKLLQYMVTNKQLICSGEIASLGEVIFRSIQIKADVVALDERESGPRMKLNFGHTIGHAIEAATGYGTILHGEAVAWGAIAALHLGVQRRAIGLEQFEEVAACIYAFGPLPRFEASAQELVRLSGSDKKVRSGKRAFVLPVAAGQVEIVYDVTEAELLSATEAMLSEMALRGVESSTL